jgi:hypothetical protein
MLKCTLVYISVMATYIDATDSQNRGEGDIAYNS